MRYDLVSLGEPLLRLAPPGHCQLRMAGSLDVVVVGSQLNVAANLARLGKRAAFLTKLPDNPLGLLALDSCMSYGLDVSHIKLVPGGKMGATYVEFSAAPRAPVAVYDRAGSAASTVSADDFDWDAVLCETKYAHTDGIFPGLSKTCSAATEAFFDSARRNGCLTSFDVNYREHLWSPEEARNSFSSILPKVDILATSRGVSELVFGYSGTDEEIMRRYGDEFGCKLVCMTAREIIGLKQGAWSSKALTHGGVVCGRRREFEIVDRYGTGDAWFAGFLYGYMEHDVEFALNFGNASCALAHTIEGDVAHLRCEDVMAVMGDSTDLRVRR